MSRLAWSTLRLISLCPWEARKKGQVQHPRTKRRWLVQSADCRHILHLGACTVRLKKQIYNHACCYSVTSWTTYLICVVQSHCSAAMIDLGVSRRQPWRPWGEQNYVGVSSFSPPATFHLAPSFMRKMNCFSCSAFLLSNGYMFGLSTWFVSVIELFVLWKNYC